ncbi:uncharacterized protein LOC131671879 [Phymastichus coffea]|uniref:uncharacterized protein LOC131671879 n=1 Tax=Phymastichus coffea TaxID=108790 RepID=UPI00273B6681|nr:uncharacterized protein LOC131671879 [Phymastichus coffea]
MLSMLRYCKSRIAFSVQTKIIPRKYMTVSEKVEMLLKQRDHVPHTYKLIYRDLNHTFVGFSYHGLNFLTYITLTSLAYMWYNDIPMQKNSHHFALSKTPIEQVIVSIGICSLVYISYWLRQRFVLRLYFSEKAQNYKMIFIGRVPFSYEHMEFPAKSVIFATPKDSAFPWRNTIFKINNRKVYLFEDNFRTYSDFLHMLKPGEECTLE